MLTLMALNPPKSPTMKPRNSLPPESVNPLPSIDRFWAMEGRSPLVSVMLASKTMVVIGLPGTGVSAARSCSSVATCTVCAIAGAATNRDSAATHTEILNFIGGEYISGRHPTEQFFANC